MRRNKVLAVVTAAALVVSSLAGAGSTAPNREQSVKAAEHASIAEDNAVFDNYNASEITLNMGAGWNLGNQLECPNASGKAEETAWGNPKITQKTLDMVKNAGFKTVRIPVSYFKHINDEQNYTINSEWLDRVQEVVDYAVNDGLYVIINIHHDGGDGIDYKWLDCVGADQDIIKAKFKRCWEQIADRFKDYDEHLIFESMNELKADEKKYSKATIYGNINAYNQIFVDTVRESGGYNDQRWLLIPGFDTNIDSTTGNEGFAIPTDNNLSSEVPSGENRIMISVHYYDPYTFALGYVPWWDSNAKTTQWGDNAKDTSKIYKDNWGNKTYMMGQMKKLYDTFISSGYPVVIGEYGAVDYSREDSLNLVCRKDFYQSLCTYAKQYGCIPVAWDNGGTGTSGENQFGLFNRRTLQATENGAEILASIMSVYYEGGMEEVELAAAKEQAASVIREAESKNQADYPAEKWNSFAQALADAKAKAADSQATAAQIKAATAALQEAMSNLTQTTQSPGPEGSQPPQSTSPEGSQPPASEAPQSTSPEGSQPPASSVPQSPGPEGSQAPGSSMEPTPTETPDSDADSVAGVKIKKVTSPKKATIKVTWKKAADVSGYAVKLGTNSKVTKSVKNVTIKQANKTSVTVKKCKRKKKYYVKVCAYVLKDGKKVYGKWSKTKKVKVK